MFVQVARRLYHAIWGKDLGGILLDVPYCEGVRWILCDYEAWVTRQRLLSAMNTFLPWTI